MPGRNQGNDPVHSDWIMEALYEPSCGLPGYLHVLQIVRKAECDCRDSQHYQRQAQHGMGKADSEENFENYAHQ